MNIDLNKVLGNPHEMNKFGKVMEIINENLAVFINEWPIWDAKKKPTDLVRVTILVLSHGRLYMQYETFSDFERDFMFADPVVTLGKVELNQEKEIINIELVRRWPDRSDTISFHI